MKKFMDLRSRLKFSQISVLVFSGISLTACDAPGGITPLQFAKVAFCYAIQGCDPPTPLKPITAMEQAKWNHFTDDEIAREPDWAIREHMRRTRRISDQAVPLHLGHLTFMVPLNYLGYYAGIENIDLKAGLRRDDARSGNIRFFLPDFSGLTPRRIDFRHHNDPFVQYNFGIRSYTPARVVLTQFPGQYNFAPDFLEYGLEGFLPNLAEAAGMSLEERRKRFGMEWIGKSVHGAEVGISCSPGVNHCSGFGSNPIGGYDYSFALPLSDLPRWLEIETGVHTKIMAWRNAASR